MRYAKRQNTRRRFAGKHIGIIAARLGKGDLLFYERGTVGTVLLHTVHQIAISHRRVVKIGNGFIQALDRKIGKLLLKITEGIAGVIKHLGRINGVIGKAVGHEIVYSPHLAVRVGIILFAVAAGLAVKRFTLGIASLGNDLIAQKGCYHVDICHKLIRLFENLGVHHLQQILHFGGAYFKFHPVGAVDMPVVDRAAGNEFTRNGKIFYYFYEFFRVVHIKTSFLFYWTELILPYFFTSVNTPLCTQKPVEICI